MEGSQFENHFLFNARRRGQEVVEENEEVEEDVVAGQRVTCAI